MARRPAKLSLLIALTIWTILRAVRFKAVSSAYFPQSPELSEMWQSVQFKPKDAEKKPIVPMSSLAEIPLRTWMFLKTSSANCGFSWDLAGTTHNSETEIVAMAPGNLRVGLDVMLSPLRLLFAESLVLASGHNNHLSVFDCLGRDTQLFFVVLVRDPPVPASRKRERFGVVLRIVHRHRHL